MDTQAFSFCQPSPFPSSHSPAEEEIGRYENWEKKNKTLKKGKQEEYKTLFWLTFFFFFLIGVKAHVHMIKNGNVQNMHMMKSLYLVLNSLFKSPSR